MNTRNFLALALVGLGLQANAADKEKSPEAQPAPAAAKAGAKVPHVYPKFGHIDRLDPALDALLAPGAEIEKLAEGFKWSEGPVWIANGQYLLFSDVPNNVVFRWKEGEKTTDWILPSGYTGKTPRGGEPGSNGLTLDASGRLVLCQHGDRQVARREANGKFTPLAQYYNYRRFNSPNDVAFRKNGDFYFTDPPYGLVKNVDDPAKELPFQGVYRVTPKGKVDLLTRELTRPNGIAFSPDEKKMYVAVSDSEAPNYWVYDVRKDGLVENGRILFSAKHLIKTGPGMPDGLKVDLKGNLWASGPGGILIITPEGKHLGTINTGQPTANCAWGNDGSTLYITANHILCRIKTLSKGAMPGAR